MYTVDDITGFFLDNTLESKPITKRDFKGMPIIESWVGLNKEYQVIVKGRIHNHPHHTQGVKIRTSGVTGYFSEKGRVYITTKNSIYELGQPLNEGEMTINFPDCVEREKMTIWN